MSTTDLHGQTPTTATLRRVLPRGAADVDSIIPTVKPIVDDVAARGVEAVVEYFEKFDHIRPVSMRVPAEVINAAEAALEDDARSALQESIGHVRVLHATQKPSDKAVELLPGGIVREKWIPVSCVGPYVPGGNAVYPSSVLMSVIPAQEAGVESPVVVSPPQTDNDDWLHPTILAACKLLDVTEVWAVGGAQVVAPLAYGDEDGNLEPIGMITGPGGIFATAARRLCRSVVDIDAEAGPTEITIPTDNIADPVSVTCGLISQAEHDVVAASILITDDADFAITIDHRVESHYRVTINADRVREALTSDQSGIVLVDDMNIDIQVADAYAAGHLEIHTENAQADAECITNAGAIFIGHSSLVPLGDYSAGSNHVLPTSGTTHHASDLLTRTFLKSVRVIDYSEAALKEVTDSAIVLTDGEQLPTHGEAIRARFETFLSSEVDDAEKGNN